MAGRSGRNAVVPEAAIAEQRRLPVWFSPRPSSMWRPAQVLGEGSLEHRHTATVAPRQGSVGSTRLASWCSFSPGSDRESQASLPTSRPRAASHCLSNERRSFEHRSCWFASSPSATHTSCIPVPRPLIGPPGSKSSSRGGRRSRTVTWRPTTCCGVGEAHGPAGQCCNLRSRLSAREPLVCSPSLPLGRRLVGPMAGCAR